MYFLAVVVVVWIICAFPLIYFKHIIANSDNATYRFMVDVFAEEIPGFRYIWYQDFLIGLIAPIVWAVYLSKKVKELRGNR